MYVSHLHLPQSVESESLARRTKIRIIPYVDYRADPEHFEDITCLHSYFAQLHGQAPSLFASQPRRKKRVENLRAVTPLLWSILQTYKDEEDVD